MISAFVVSIVLQSIFGLDSDNPVQFAQIMLITVAITTVVWLAVTFATAPEPDAKLISFYRRVRPSEFGWKPIAKLAPDVPPARDFGWNMLDWLCGCAMIYGALFGTGKIILKETATGLAFLAVAVVASLVIYFDLSRRGWKTVAE